MNAKFAFILQLVRNPYRLVFKLTYPYWMSQIVTSNFPDMFGIFIICETPLTFWRDTNRLIEGSGQLDYPGIEEKETRA